MNTLNKEENKAVAADIFKRYPNAKKVAVTSDGMAFITDESENAVLNHSKNNRHKKELEITRFTRDGVEGKRQKAEDNQVEGKKEKTGGKKADADTKTKPEKKENKSLTITHKAKKADVKADETPKTEA
ncbi:MAG: hypothetical protein A2W90_17980 [Bacteroidetes bacterium GWF2_42_66]|nr:MAG: hypothetical protein A2W92_22240 [Bacteroidetes bacterium GWA2_42_15]OFX98141.1 MAG: hypothetical protein A2W89_09470 [Bacteroidetes bacterium GWE2_42_39]OFY42526.1 MAG: hypothetical protein A2W90_17980 [Bacteroidetes bacterium GWF2_42_66]HBL74242.1 hypothetical protein [Prolixibacteraceae bacterium]HCU64011.1 hypothetical protein [Prolixibacteraceae bacterium]